MVPGGLEDDRAEERDLGARAATGVGLGVVSDGVGDAAPLLAGGSSPRPDRLAPGRKGRAIGTKDQVAVAVEQNGAGLGRCRLQLIGDAGAVTLGQFLHDNVVEGSTVITDGWQPYRAATRSEHHDRRVATGADPTGAGPAGHPRPAPRRSALASRHPLTRPTALKWRPRSMP